MRSGNPLQFCFLDYRNILFIRPATATRRRGETTTNHAMLIALEDYNPLKHMYFQVR